MLCVGLYGLFLFMLQSLTFGAVESVGEQMFTNTTCTACQGLLCEDKESGAEPLIPQSHFELSPGITALVMLLLSLPVLLFRDTLDSWVCGVLGVGPLEGWFQEKMLHPVQHIFAANYVFFGLSVSLDSSQQPTTSYTLDFIFRQLFPLGWAAWVMRSRTYYNLLWTRRVQIFVVQPLRVTIFLLTRPVLLDMELDEWANYLANVILLHHTIGIVTNTSVAQHIGEVMLCMASCNFLVYTYSWIPMFNNVGICVVQLLAIVVKRVYLNWLQGRQVPKQETSLTTHIQNWSIALVSMCTHLICQVLVLADFKSQRLFICLHSLLVDFMRQLHTL